MSARYGHSMEVELLKPIMFVFTSIVFALVQASPTAVPTEVRTEDSALLRIPGAVLYNNVFGKGDIAHYRQSVFQGKNNAGWDWDWPDNGTSEVKSYPEVLVGRSPWGDAGGIAGAAELRAGSRLPGPLSESHQTIDFDATTLATGAWDLSFDFWITNSDHPTSKEIVSDLTIFIVNHGSRFHTKVVP